ncbi:unnamed protein product [Bemisia tabaci]|uniref:Uncharacterized protein n=1 Tax=Bemisia tabaci TaxID=7038 RepID=A0A9P0F7U7_BEMTA|nr:unnamed protein product [Bemisia tabaci]
MDIVKRNYDLSPAELYDVKQGDDIFIYNQSALWAAVLFKVMNRMGCVFNLLKQMFGQYRGEYLRVLCSNGAAHDYTGRALVQLFTKQLQQPTSLLAQQNLTALDTALVTLGRRRLPFIALLVLHHDLSNHFAKQRAFSLDPAPVKLPPAITWRPALVGGYDCAPPMLTPKPTFQHLPSPTVQLEADRILSQLPHHMTDDWVRHVSGKFAIITPIRTEALRKACMQGNYNDVLRQSVSLSYYKKFKSEWRRILQRRPHLLQPVEVQGVGDVDWWSHTGYYSVPATTSAFNKPNREPLPPIALLSDVERALTQPLSQVHGPSNLLKAVMLCASKTPFKSVPTTMTALSMTEIEAIEFVIKYVTSNDISPADANQFLAQMVNQHTALPLHILLTSAHGFIGAIRYFLHPQLSIEINANIKMMISTFVLTTPEHNAPDWIHLWNHRALELLAAVRSKVDPKTGIVRKEEVAAAISKLSPNSSRDSKLLRLRTPKEFEEAFDALMTAADPLPGDSSDDSS